MLKVKTVLSIIGIMACMTLWYSCSAPKQDGDEHHIMEHTSVGERVSKFQDSIEYSVSSAMVMEQMKTVLAEIHDTVQFLIPERTSQIKSFPCSNCHNKPVEQLTLGRKPNERKAHWDIKIIHGKEEVMNCNTCHNKIKTDELVSLTGMPIAFDASFKLCSQCHSTQYKDWVGGSHGKRLGGWTPPRISNTCVNCHNPHKPAFETRWPARLNTVMQSQTNPEK